VPQCPIIRVIREIRDKKLSLSQREGHIPVVHYIFGAVSLLPAGARRRLVRWALDRIWGHYMRLRVEGLENLPAEPCLFIANHLSNADGITINKVLHPRKVYFLAGVKLQGTTMTRIVAEVVDTIPIRPGSPDVEALKRAVATLKGGESVLIFPEGGRSRTGQLIRGHKGAGFIAKKADVPVVPIALTGTEKFLPISQQNMGGESVHHAEVTVRIGRPFRAEDLTGGFPEGADGRQALVDAMMLRIASLLPPHYQGVYKNGFPKEELVD
jgi:1-acyl-sn-glycerol-3-phosphate acyltransferase